MDAERKKEQQNGEVIPGLTRIAAVLRDDVALHPNLPCCGVLTLHHVESAMQL